MGKDVVDERLIGKTSFVRCLPYPLQDFRVQPDGNELSWSVSQRRSAGLQIAERKFDDALRPSYSTDVPGGNVMLTKRVEILLDPAEIGALHRLAKKTKKSVGALIREPVN